MINPMKSCPLFFDTLSRCVQVDTHASLRSKRSPLGTKKSNMDSQAIRMKNMKHHSRDQCDFHVPETARDITEKEKSLNIKMKVTTMEMRRLPNPFCPSNFSQALLGNTDGTLGCQWHDAFALPCTCC